MLLGLDEIVGEGDSVSDPLAGEPGEIATGIARGRRPAAKVRQIGDRRLGAGKGGKDVNLALASLVALAIAWKKHRDDAEKER